MSSSDESSEESDISDQEYSDEYSSESSSDDSSSEDSDDSDGLVRKKSSRWRRRRRQLRRRVQEAEEEAEEKAGVYNTYASANRKRRIAQMRLQQNNASLIKEEEEEEEAPLNAVADPRTQPQKDKEIAEAEAKEAAEALAREQAETEAKAEDMRKQQALLAAMMSALSMIKMMQKKIQGNITKLKENKPETENLTMAPTLLWTCQVNGLAKNMAADIAIDIAIKLATGCIKFKDIAEIRKSTEKITTWENSKRVGSRLKRAVKEIEKIEEVRREASKLEKLNQLKGQIGSEYASRASGNSSTGKAIKLGSKIWSKGLKNGILDVCDIPMMFVRTLFGKYPEECNQQEDIEEFFKYPGREPFDSIETANQFYGKILLNTNEQKPLIEGGKYIPPSKEMESALQKRRTKRKTDDDDKKRTIDVFSDTGAKSSFQIEDMFNESKENPNYIRTKSSKQRERKNIISMDELTKIIRDPKTRQNIVYWSRGVFQEKAKNLSTLLPWPAKRWVAGLVIDDNPVPYCASGCLTDDLGLWVRKLNININFGPNFTYDHYGCIFSIDLEGEKEFQPYYNPNGVKHYMKDKLDSQYNSRGLTLAPHAPHPGHVKFQLRRMYQRAIDVGFKPVLTDKDKVIVEDDLLKSYCECFEKWSEDMDTQRRTLQEWTKMKTMQEMSIINQYQKIQSLNDKKQNTN